MVRTIVLNIRINNHGGETILKRFAYKLGNLKTDFFFFFLAALGLG